jgi:hypothetical protein
MGSVVVDGLLRRGLGKKGEWAKMKGGGGPDKLGLLLFWAHVERN